LRLKDIREPLAIAMWDTGWLTRHYPYGSFEDWDKTLDELVDRGYNAIRIEAFPHLIAAGSDGVIQERFFRSRGEGMGHMWRNPLSLYLEPRAGLPVFLRKCRERGVYVGLSTWFPDVRENRHKHIQGVDEFVRIWHETLIYLDDQGLLDNVIYVDLLNEYPLWHQFEWLNLVLDSISAPHKDDFKGTLEEENFKYVDGQCYNPRQFDFYNSFASETVVSLKERWPALDFFYSFSHSNSTPWYKMDLTNFDALDVHHWFSQNIEFSNSVGYFDFIHTTLTDVGYEPYMNKIRKEWPVRKSELTQWMRSKLEYVAEVGNKLDVPYGNTEGWGPIMWREHPLLDWNFVKESGVIGAQLGAELGYAFNCSSNFTHPQFQGLWADIEWHREVTSIIRGN